MTRIEKTQINSSAFIILSSTLKKLKSDRIVEIVNDGKGIIVRKKEPGEKEDFQIDLDFLGRLLKHMVMGSPAPIVLTGEAEEYLRNCSYACDYYRKEKDSWGVNDHFDIFHKIHFPNTDGLQNDEDMVRQFCRLFWVDENLCTPFLDCQDDIGNSMKLLTEQNFMQRFENLTIDEQGTEKKLKFQSKPLKMQESLDSLFTIKDLLSCRKVDTSQIPEANQFSIQADEKVDYSLTTENLKIELSFKYSEIQVEIIKNCAQHSV